MSKRPNSVQFRKKSGFKRALRAHAVDGVREEGQGFGQVERAHLAARKPLSKQEEKKIPSLVSRSLFFLQDCKISFFTQKTSGR